jgi:ankyrin repeat protein
MSFLWRSAAVQRSFIMQDKPNHVHSMTDAGLDDATLEFAHQVFDLARSGESDELARLLGRGLPPNLRNNKGDSLLMLASYHGHLDTVRVLLDHKADPDLRNLNGQTPIAGAAFKGNLPMIELLIEHGADIEGASPDGRTTLMIAAMFNRTEIVDYLVSHGANVDVKDVNGVDAVQAAKLMGAQNTSARLEALQRGGRPVAD